MLGGLEEHKTFLVELSHTTWITEQDKQKKSKRDRIKRDWIDFHKKDRRDDGVIFREDDDVFTNEASKAGASTVGDQVERKGEGPPATGGKAKKTQAIQQLKRENMSERDWEAKFEFLLGEDLVELPEDFFDEDLFFTNPHDLNNIFSELEEKNLYLIHMSQEVEQSLETLKQEFAKKQTELGKEQEMHLGNKNALSDQIVESQKNYNELRKRNQVTTISTQATAANDKDKDKGEHEVNIEELLNDLRKDIIRVYKSTKDYNVDLHAKQTIDVLTVRVIWQLKVCIGN